MTLSHCDRKVKYTFLEGNLVKHIYLLGKKNSTSKNLSNQNSAAYWWGKKKKNLEISINRGVK